MFKACFGLQRRKYAHLPEPKEAVGVPAFRPPVPAPKVADSSPPLTTIPASVPTPIPQVGDDLLWEWPLSNCTAGQFSFSVVQANNIVEDHSEVHSGPLGTYVGIYDGHGGPQTAQFLNERLYVQFKKALFQNGAKVGEDVFKNSFAAVEEEFMELVRQGWEAKPQLAAVGSCALVGVVSEQTLYVASLGDSRAVLGTLHKANGAVTAVQMSTDHNANQERIRVGLALRYPNDKDIVVEKNGIWRVKGIIQVSKAIGDVYLKSAEFQRPPLFPRFLIPTPLVEPVLEAEPTVIVREIKPMDQFVILASDGLWEQVSNQEAVEIVHSVPTAERDRIAQELVLTALLRAAKKRDISYDELKMLNKGQRRQFHDDISVVVLFFRHEARDGPAPTGRQMAEISIKSFSETSEGARGVPESDDESTEDSVRVGKR
eukprot:TRINITY_DN856_c0_g1_i1.p1 TRINITY_DN856_c0_g1~~TRINITY_DN856_c0_g1_i1.p1  ORF type:complete len:430 (+),score=89.57 TRINITY_DN856_c0_g1_i1:302-1591(+)